MRHIPLDVKTHQEGFLRLQGWTCLSVLAFLTGVLLVLYELVVINVEDTDFRDLLFDYRATQPGIMYEHKHFVNAQFCCNQDPHALGYVCRDSALAAYSAAPQGWYAKAQPFCPPLVRFTCADEASPECALTRQAVYSAAGLDPSTGEPANCGRAGRVRVGVARGNPGASSISRLSVEWRGSQQAETLVITDNRVVNQSQLAAFFDAVARRYAEPHYATPPAPLSHSLLVGGQRVPLVPRFEPGMWDSNDFGWPWELWPFPPGWACANTGRPPALYLSGKAAFAFSDYEDSMPPTVAFQFFNDRLELPQYRLESSGTANGSLQQAAARGSASAGISGVCILAAVAEAAATAAGAPGAEAQPEEDVVLRALTAVVLRAGSVPLLDTCNAWVLDQEWFGAEYGLEVWRGTRAELQALTGRSPALAAGQQTLSVQLRDVSEPLPLALPRYAGNIYIYAALVMGGVWMFLTVPLLAAYGIVFINVQRNRGLPLFVYRYMRSFRGW